MLLDKKKKKDKKKIEGSRSLYKNNNKNRK